MASLHLKTVATQIISEYNDAIEEIRKGIMSMITDEIKAIKVETGMHVIINNGVVRFLLLRISNNSMLSLYPKLSTKNITLFHSYTVMDFVTNPIICSLKVPTVLAMFSKEMEGDISLHVELDKQVNLVTFYIDIKNDIWCQ